MLSLASPIKTFNQLFKCRWLLRNNTNLFQESLALHSQKTFRRCGRKAFLRKCLFQLHIVAARKGKNKHWLNSFRYFWAYIFFTKSHRLKKLKTGSAITISLTSWNNLRKSLNLLNTPRVDVTPSGDWIPTKTL